MRQINIDNLRRDLTKELSDLPFEIIKRGKVIATVLRPNLKVQDSNTPNLKVQHDHVITSNKLDGNGKLKTYFKK